MLAVVANLSGGKSELHKMQTTAFYVFAIGGHDFVSTAWARDERYLERYAAQRASVEIVSARQTSPTISVLLLSHER
jgi:hypothetical protein